jgi:hypothetical protein
MSPRLKAKLYSLATAKNLRVIYVLVVISAIALAAGAANPFGWGGTGP